MTDIEINLFNEICDRINEAARKGLDESGTVDPDDDFRTAILRNNEVFAAFKVHRMQNDMARLLLDSNGNLKPFEQWRKEVMPIASHQVGQWLRTEYNTAVLRAHQAADWQQFEREKDVLPNLRWMPSTSVNPGKDHMVFWGTVRPIDDPFWNEHRPGDRWNCKCDLSSTDDPVTEIPDFTRKDNPHPGLDNNPGKDGKLFSDTHPYIANAYPGAKKAVERLMGKLDAVREAEESIRGIIEQIETGYTQGISVIIGNLSEDVRQFLLKKGIELQTDEVYMTDKQIQHALRTVKQNAGKSVTAEQLVAFPSLMGKCEVYWDKQKRNIQFITRQGNEVQKFVVELNYRTKIWGVKKTVNAFITAGIIEERNLGMQNIIKIK
ncbi:phage minor head protein [Barnesiella intestinihominis]|uniref:phage head morphogenesis protein n=1 Tax=Barnesiella intestinihominis TaxID=487174 RepID=UPI001896F984|nr:phage minor head protein [Barnesiella intestinihominis]MDB0664581.1 phage minor head protein [Barnesiella intestinihominis]MDB0666853.1 phage minor head protein [Barnesiella intestinihominis]